MQIVLDDTGVPTFPNAPPSPSLLRNRSFAPSVSMSPLTPSPVVNRVLGNYRSINGSIVEVSSGALNSHMVRRLTLEHRSISRVSDIFTMYLHSHFTLSSADTIISIVDDLPFESLLERLSSAGLPIQEAAFLLNLLTFCSIVSD